MHRFKPDRVSELREESGHEIPAQSKLSLLVNGKSVFPNGASFCHTPGQASGTGVVGGEGNGEYLRGAGEKNNMIKIYYIKNSFKKEKLYETSKY